MLKNLIKLRKQLGITQEELAKESDMHARNYRRIENEGQEIKLYDAIAIYKYIVAVAAQSGGDLRDLNLFNLFNQE